MMDGKPYVVLIGDAGTGKSTLVEKITEETGRSSASSTSATLTSELFESFDGSLIICDTPGTNSMTDQFKHNLQVAHALNFHPVSLILIVVKADVRMETVSKNVREYMERFLPEDLPIDLVGVCITHMDTVEWGRNELSKVLKKNFGIDSLIFSSLGMERKNLVKAIEKESLKIKPVNINVDSELFLKLFKINNNHIKILRETRKEVVRFEKLKRDFFDEKEKYSKDEQKDMIFEFQAWMFEEIIECQKRLSESNDFSFSGGPGMANEAGHIANLTNQLREVLRFVRIAATEYHVDVITDFRKCPHCGEIWQKVEGCDGITECGKRPSGKFDVVSTGKMANFEFLWDSITQKLATKKVSQRDRINASKLGSKADEKTQGCGKEISWGQMSPAEVPKDFHAAVPVCTDDVQLIQQEHKESWRQHFEKTFKDLPKLAIKQSNSKLKTN